MIRVGVVCEGPTDFLAISFFLAASLRAKGLEAAFVDIQPELDATSASYGGGWSNALAWIENNPLESRLASYLGGGLFADGLSGKTCDYLLIQIDADVLDSEDFLNYVKKRRGIDVSNPVTPPERFDEVQRVLLVFCELSDELDARSKMHVIAPAVENTETWCVCALEPVLEDVEVLRKALIAEEFCNRLSAFEGVATNPRAIKNVERRRVYCERNSEGHARIENQCTQYLRLVSWFIG